MDDFHLIDRLHLEPHLMSGVGRGFRENGGLMPRTLNIYGLQNFEDFHWLGVEASEKLVSIPAS